MIEFQVLGHTYRAEKLDLFTAADVGRRLTPVIPSVGSFLYVREEAGSVEELMRVIEPLVKAVAQMPKADWDFVFASCLSSVSVKVDGDRGWQTILVPGASRPMFDFIDLTVAVQIIRNVLEHNFASFFAGLSSTSSEEGPKA
jgi:hypothetical protein